MLNEASLGLLTGIGGYRVNGYIEFIKQGVRLSANESRGAQAGVWPAPRGDPVAKRCA